MKKPVLIDGIPYISKTFKIQYELYERFDQERVDGDLTPSELINIIFEERYARSPVVL